jgi:fructose-bisphosphate aldolase class II
MALHQDHGNSPETCKSAIEMGFTSVMMDGSLMSDGKTPSTFEYNVQVTRQVVEMAHARGVAVEGEIGVLGGIEDGHGAGGSGLEHVTDPDQAVEFVEKTGVDSLAIAIGTSHGAYKFTKKPTGETLKMDVLIAIHKRLPRTHLVMHGSSSVPQDLQEIINKYGGKLKPTWGVPVEEIQLGIKNGVRKVNVDTDSRLAITGAIRKVFWETPEKFDPRDYLKPARDAMKKVVALRMTQFGQAGHAGDYKPVALSEMAKRYAGETVSV